MTVSGPHANSATSSKSSDSLVALVCLTIASNHNPAWASAPVTERAQEEGVSRFRVSRIKSAVQGRFVSLIEEASRRGPRGRRPFRCGA